MTSEAPAYDAVVLAGGGARRLGGADKPGVRVGGRALLDRVLAACADAAVTVVVAGRRPTLRPVRWTREDPPGSGPVAALDAGLRQVTADTVLVLSADLPFLDEGTVRGLLAGLETGAGGETGADEGPAADAGDGQGVLAEAEAGFGAGSRRGAVSALDGVLLVDSGGRDQPLVAVYRVPALRRELAALADAYGGLGGLPLRKLVGRLRLARVPGPLASFDCDTWDDIAAARARIREHDRVLDEWISAAKDELGIDLDVDTALLLDLARDAAHGVARPAAPLTTFLVGYAAGRAQGGPEAVAEASRKAAALALRWAQEAEEAEKAKSGDTVSDGSGPGAG